MVLLPAAPIGGSMRAYSMDLRERVLRDSDAGLTAAAVAVQIPCQCLLGPAAQTTAAGDRRSRAAPAAVRAASGARAAAAHARGADPGATRPHPRGPAGRPGHVRQSGDDLAGRETAGLHPTSEMWRRCGPSRHRIQTADLITNRTPPSATNASPSRWTPSTTSATRARRRK